jgi:hypothetical protein
MDIKKMSNQRLDELCKKYCLYDKPCYKPVMECPYYVHVVGYQFKYKYNEGQKDK